MCAVPVYTHNIRVCWKPCHEPKPSSARRLYYTRWTPIPTHYRNAIAFHNQNNIITPRIYVIAARRTDKSAARVPIIKRSPPVEGGS